MKRRWWWLLLLLVILGVARLRFDAEVLNLLPGDLPAVQGLKLYQEHFANARELIITVTSSEAEQAEVVAREIGDLLRSQTNLVAEVTSQPPWFEHPEQTAELIAHLWLNQPPEVFAQLTTRLAETNLPVLLQATRDQLATTLSPADIAQLSYDPFGFTRLPENVAGLASQFGDGQSMFSSADGKFRVLYVKARDDLPGYRECMEWLGKVMGLAHSLGDSNGVQLGFTGRPAFVAEISGSMQHDITLSVFGTAIIIAILFWFAHRRWKPMLWLLTLLAVVLASTLALGGLLFGTINVISMGFAAILLGLAVDYAVVHYQEALAHPDLSVPQIRRAIAPSIFWAAVTTITAFLVLNFGGLPGLAQLGSLVGIGVALSALVMIFAFLPPLFPARMNTANASISPPNSHAARQINPRQGDDRTFKPVMIFTLGACFLCILILLRGLPAMDSTADALRPRDSQAYATLDRLKANLSQNRDPLWVLISGRDEIEVAARLNTIEPALQAAVSNGVLASFHSPALLWPQPGFQSANRAAAQDLIARRPTFHAAANDAGFAADALDLTGNILETWQRATTSTNVFWPTNALCSWILEKMVARSPGGFYAAGFLFPATNDTVNVRALAAQLPDHGVWLSGWELLGDSVHNVVRKNFWKLVAPMMALVLLSLWLAFRRPAEILLSLVTLALSAMTLLAVMKLAGWSWNLLNLMAVPLILGTGVDYSLFMQLALRRHAGDLVIAHRSVGRALLLCGGTAVAGFGMLGLSSNAGMASLGQVCAIGIAGNMLVSVYLLPSWWRLACVNRSAGLRPGTNEPAAKNADGRLALPSTTYCATVWQLGLFGVRLIPDRVCRWAGRIIALCYRWLCPSRVEVVEKNLLPVLAGDRAVASRTTRDLFRQFAFKIVDLWRFESGSDMQPEKAEWHGWEIFAAAQARGKGVLIVTPHLGNWEFGASFFTQKGIPLLVLTQPEPDARLTEIRQASRLRHGIETLVVGENPYAFVEIIQRLNAGVTVALLIDRPPATSAVTVELFGRPFQTSIAAAELARASGCAIVPGYIVRKQGGYEAGILPEIPYDRAAIGNRDARIRLTQEILKSFEPIIRQHADQWYHFVPVWKT